MWRSLRGQAQVHTSSGILAEMEEKLRRKFGFSPRHAHLLTRFVLRQTVLVEITRPPPCD
jgi:hypothetical protein